MRPRLELTRRGAAAAALVLTAALGVAAGPGARAAAPDPTAVVPAGLPACDTTPDLAPQTPPGPATDPSVPHCLGPSGLRAAPMARNPRLPDVATGGGQTAPGVSASCSSTNCSIFNGQYTSSGAYRAAYSNIQVVAPTLPNTNFGTFYTAWTMDSRNGSNWAQGGWIEGNIGGSCGTYTHPVAWLQINNNGDLTNTYCYPAYTLNNGSTYAFETYATANSGNVWCNAIYYNSKWNILGGACYTMSAQNASQTDAEQAVEYSAPTSTSAFPHDAGQSMSYAEVYPNGGGWKTWDTSVPTGIADSAYQIDQWMGYDGSYFDTFHTTRTNPDFSLSASPSSMTVLPSQTGTSTITTTTNTSYDSRVLGQGITYAVFGAPSGSSASLSTSGISPSSSTTRTATLTVKVGLTQVSSFTVTVQACGWNGCKDTYVTVSPT